MHAFYLYKIFTESTQRCTFIKINTINKFSDKEIIDQTIAWVRTVVIGCNFCPFAAKALNKGSVRFVVRSNTDLKICLETLSEEFQYLNENASVETTLIILPADFEGFAEYLDMINKAELFLAKENYEGVYQLASFHPQYRFAGAPDNDPANYTNRSPYPMLHILREDSITNALEGFAHPENIPNTNIDFAGKKGLKYMELLLAACMR